jgi:hypothetical protein
MPQKKEILRTGLFESTIRVRNVLRHSIMAEYPWVQGTRSVWVMKDVQTIQ